MEFVSFAPVAAVIYVFIELNAKRSRRPLYVECITRCAAYVCVCRDEADEYMDLKWSDRACDNVCIWIVSNKFYSKMWED